MPTFTYTVADFVAFTKIRSADVNSRFADIKTFFNTTKLDDSNIQDAGITRATKLKTGTAGAIVVNAASTGVMSELADGALGTILTGAGTTVPPTFLAAGTAGQYLRTNGSGVAPSYAASPDSDSNIVNLSLTASVAANALTIALKGNDGNDPSATNAVSVGFRSATAATGTYTVRYVNAATSFVVSSGSTLGQTSAQPEYIYVYALDNAGTVELAVSTSKDWDEGSRQSTTAEGGAGAADSRVLLYSTTARTNVAVRLIGRIKSTQTVAGTWATAVSEIAGQQHNPKWMPISEIKRQQGNGHGSSDTDIRRFINTIISRGTDITLTSNSTNGDFFTINAEGMYTVSYIDSNSSALIIGITVNSTSLATSIANSANYNFRRAIHVGGNEEGNVQATMHLFPGDIVRAHTDGSGNLSNNNDQTVFWITRVH